MYLNNLKTANYGCQIWLIPYLVLWSTLKTVDVATSFFSYWNSITVNAYFLCTTIYHKQLLSVRNWRTVQNPQFKKICYALTVTHWSWSYPKSWFKVTAKSFTNRRYFGKAWARLGRLESGQGLLLSYPLT